MTDHPGDLEGSDRDVGEIGTEMRDLRGEMRNFRQATITSFNAVRDDYVDLRSRVDGGFSRVDDGFTEIRGRLDTTAAGLTHITDLLDGLVAERETD